MYSDIKRNTDIIKKTEPVFSINFINGPYLEIGNSPGDEYEVSFADTETGRVHYQAKISNGQWCRCNISYFVKWKISIVKDGKVFEYDYEPKGKKVLITLESKSIGDTLAWVPYAEEFRKKWGCKVVFSTFWNHLFQSEYPEIEFVPPGSVVNGIYAMYKIGWFYGEDGNVNLQLNPRDFKKHSLQQTAADILGIEFSHIKPRIKAPEVEKRKRVGIGFHSTAQTKYWNNETGWQEVCDFLTLSGYEVMVLSKEGDGYMGNYFPIGATKLEEGSFENLIEVMSTCEIFIGVGSGLSWLAWSLNIPTVLISGFSTPVSEFEGEGVIRIFNESACNGCYNRYRLNAGDWNWCPDHKGTERQFECTKKITGGHVINRLISGGFIKKEAN